MSEKDLPHDDHGSSPAAWTAVAIITLAFVLGTLAVVWGNWVLFWVSAGIVVLGGIVGKVMSMMGFGNKPAHH
jgi:hypothetical protein